jgi:protein-tyrosine-phosphatase
MDVLCIDFAGNAGTHSLVGPLDVLAGRELPAELRAVAEKARGEEGFTADVLAALEAEERAEVERRAAEDERRRKAKVRAEARYAAEVVDPFEGGYQGAFWPEELEQAGVVRRDAGVQRARAEAATDKQVTFLRRLGVDASGMTKREASAAIGQRLQGRQRPDRAA